MSSYCNFSFIQHTFSPDFQICDILVSYRFECSCMHTYMPLHIRVLVCIRYFIENTHVRKYIRTVHAYAYSMYVYCTCSYVPTYVHSMFIYSTHTLPHILHMHIINTELYLHVLTLCFLLCEANAVVSVSMYLSQQ